MITCGVGCKSLLTFGEGKTDQPDITDNVQSHDGLVGDGYFRHALFYPLKGESKVARKGVRMYG